MHHLFRVPDLLEHYVEHKKASNNLTFVDFIRLHYSSEAGENDMEHKHLPFKSHECQHSSIVMFHQSSESSPSPEIAVSRDFVSLYLDSYHYQSIGSIFQPPQA